MPKKILQYKRKGRRAVGRPKKYKTNCDDDDEFMCLWISDNNVFYLLHRSVLLEFV